MQIDYVFIVCFHGPRCISTAAFSRLFVSSPGMGDKGTEVTRQNEVRKRIKEILALLFIRDNLPVYL